MPEQAMTYQTNIMQENPDLPVSRNNENGADIRNGNCDESQNGSLTGSPAETNAPSPLTANVSRKPSTSSKPNSRRPSNDIGTAGNTKPVIVVAAPAPVRRSTLSRLLHRDGDARDSATSSAKVTPSHSPNISRATTPSGGVSSDDSSNVVNFKRFEILPDGSHVHHFALTKRKEKLSSIFKDWMHRAEEKAKDVAIQGAGDNKGQLSLVQDFVEKKTKGYYGKDSASLVEKYGKCQEIIGKGAFGVVRVSHKNDHGKEKLFAIKEFKKRANESDKKFTKRLTSEFCISSSLHHNNIIQTLDLIQDAKGEYCEVMEYCAGGDLYSLILASGRLQLEEANCFFGQMMRGVSYLHDMGVAHRDLKPENLLLTREGTLKITDFGNGECFRMAWEKEAHKTRGLCGSAPYIAPEEYVEDEFDPRAVDVWATGVIFMAMVTGRHLWRKAKPSDDEYYARYLEDRRSRKGFEPVERQPLHIRKVIYGILDPNPEKRLTVHDIMTSDWFKSIRLCKAAEGVGVLISAKEGVGIEVTPPVNVLDDVKKVSQAIESLNVNNGDMK